MSNRVDINQRGFQCPRRYFNAKRIHPPMNIIVELNLMRTHPPMNRTKVQSNSIPRRYHSSKGTGWQKIKVVRIDQKVTCEIYTPFLTHMWLRLGGFTRLMSTRFDTRSDPDRVIYHYYMLKNVWGKVVEPKWKIIYISITGVGWKLYQGLTTGLLWQIWLSLNFQKS